MFHLDSIDLKIVDFLTREGQAQASKVARAIGDISERNVRNRINNLKKNGVIEVRAIVKPQALGFPVIADVFIEVEPGKVLEIADQIAKYDLVTYAACTTGEADMSIEVVARNNLELFLFVTNKIATVPGVKKTVTLLVPLLLKNVYEWQIPPCVINAEQKKTRRRGKKIKEKEVQAKKLVNKRRKENK